MSDFNLEVRKEGEVVVIKTSGYLNNVGGEKISEVCYKEMENNSKFFFIGFRKHKSREQYRCIYINRNYRKITRR